MVTRWGMSEALGMVQLAPRQNNWVGSAAFGTSKPYSDETARLIDTEVARIINDCHDEAKRLLQERRRELDLLVSALMKQESLDEKEIRSEEHTSKLQSLMRISYAVFCLKTKT